MKARFFFVFFLFLMEESGGGSEAVLGGRGGGNFAVVGAPLDPPTTRPSQHDAQSWR